MEAAPVIETERLVLRGHCVDDYKHVIALWTDPAVVKFIGGEPLTSEACWSRLLRYSGHWQMMDFGYWIVFRKSDAALVGEVGLADYHREISPSMEGMAEMGWALSPSMHGKGYAGEAVQAVLNWAQANIDRQICCMISSENTPSIRLAEKCGFVFFADATYHGTDQRIFMRPLSTDG